MKSLLMFLFPVAGVIAAEPLSLINMSVRLSVGPQGSGIAGFVVSNSLGGGDSPAPIRVLVRAVGPSLRQFGAPGVDRVTLQLSDIPANRIIATYSSNRAAIIAAANSTGAFPLSPFDGDDAIIVEMVPGALTAIARSGSTNSGEILIEAYKIPAPPPAPVVALPNAPTNLVVTSAIGASINLDWSDNAEPDLSRYGIYRSFTNDPRTAGKIAENSSSRFTDAGLALGVRYYYWVTAIALGLREGPKSNPTSGVANTGI